jgi:peptidoglycan/xylan/chitin deacetylase (PgdA/CDA1 family)
MTALTGKLLGTARKLVFPPVKRLLNRIDAPTVVLLYHRVARLASDPEQLAVTPEHFRAQMLHLKENHRLVRFEEDWSSLPGPAVAVTFDDGYADNAREALPILEEVGVPATFFVSTANVGNAGEFWWDELERRILSGTDFPESFALSEGGSARSWASASAAGRQQLYHDLVALLTGADLARRTGILTQLRAWRAGSPEPGDANRALSLIELKRLAASPWVSIGAHTVNHLQLSALPVEAQREEIGRSKRELESWLGREIATFSYPFGRRCHYNGESARLCREFGFRKAASNFPGQAHRWSDPYQVPRLLVRDWPVDEFAARLEGFWTR